MKQHPDDTIESCRHLIRARINDGPWLCQTCQIEVDAPRKKPTLWLINGGVMETQADGSAAGGSMDE